MPRDGAIIFRDLVGQARPESFNRFEWMDELTADCPRKQARNEFDPCGAICPDLPKVM
jgi:hypothetical protein